MKIEVELEERYKLTFENSSMCMGQYYAEDDWSIIVYGRSIIDDVLEMKYHYRYSDLQYNGGDIEKVDVILYDGNIIEIPNTEKEYKEYTMYQIYEMTFKSTEELKQLLREEKLNRILS